MRSAQPRAGGVAIRPVEAGHVDELRRLRDRAFGPVAGQDEARWNAEHALDIAGGRYLGAFDGPRLIAAARYHDMAQYWRGRAVPMAGVAGVCVAPEERGRGVGRALVTALLDLMAGQGYPLATLYPSTMPIYRSLGWEVAGVSYEAVIDARGLRPLATPDGPASPLRRPGPDDAARLRAALGQAHAAAGDCGPVLRSEAACRLMLEAGDDLFYSYLADDGVLLCTWQQGHDEMFVHTAVAASAATTRALWAVVGSHCWIAETVRARVSPADPVWWLTRDPVGGPADHDTWMLRVVDAPAAVAARGFPPSVRAAVDLNLTDQARPANAGRWRLTVGDGRGALTRPGPDGGAAGAPGGPGEPLTLDVRGLSALYAGTPLGTLRRAGLAAGDAAADAALDGVFAASPFMLDRF